MVYHGFVGKKQIVIPPLKGAGVGDELVRPGGAHAEFRVGPEQRDDLHGPAGRRRPARLQGHLAGEGPRLLVQGSMSPECITGGLLWTS